MSQTPPHDPNDSPPDAEWQREVREAARGKREYMFMLAVVKGQAARLAFIHAQDTTITHSAILMDKALMAACANGQAQSVAWLIRHGANPREGNSRAIVSAVSANSGTVLDVLLRNGASLQDAEKTHFKDGALAHAVLNRKPEAAKALLLNGCDPYRSITGGPTVYARMRDLGMPILTELSNRIWLRDVPAVPADFAARESLDRLQGVYPDHKNLTGFQLAAYNGQIGALIKRLTANGRTLTRSDLIGATPKHPQTVLFICGQRGELSQIFTPALWGNNVPAMRDALRYVPAAFRTQIDTDMLAALERRQQLAKRAQNAKPGLRLPKK